VIEDKIVSREAAVKKAQQWKAAGEKIVFTNGCFDLLHAGHVRYLEKAKALGNRLIVGLNDDESVRALKGKGRPLQPAEERAAIIAALESVDLVVVFAELTSAGLLEEIRPEVFVKGGDYTLETLNAVERETVQKHGGEIVILPLLGPSTTELIERICPQGAHGGQ